MRKTSSWPIGLFLIGLFKLAKGALFVALGIGMLKLVDKDIDDLLRNIISKLHIDAEHEFLHHTLLRLDLISNHTLKELSTLSFVFALLLFIEAIGLLWKKVWAQYLTVAETALFIPFEIYEMIRHTTLTKTVIMTINIAIVTFLVFVIVRKSNGSPDVKQVN